MQSIPMAETMTKPVPVRGEDNTGKGASPASPEPETPQEAAPLTMPEESRPEYRNELPVRQKIEGIPRCPKCGVAVSGFDESAQSAVPSSNDDNLYPGPNNQRYNEGRAAGLPLGRKRPQVLGKCPTGDAKDTGPGSTSAGNKLMALESGAKISFAGIEFYVLVPGNPELMESVDRSAQVIIAKDAATILFNLDVKSGDIVLEAGLGSASLTMPLLNLIRPGGKIISVELHEETSLKRAVENVNEPDSWKTGN